MQLLMRRPEITGFITISPPANMYDFSFLAPCPASGLIVHGEDDDIVPPASVAELIKKLAKQRDVVIDFEVMKGATHFYNEHLDRLEAIVSTYLERRTAESAAQAEPGARDSARRPRRTGPRAHTAPAPP